MDLQSKSFHLAIHQQAQGPFSFSEVTQKLSAKEISLETLGWYEGIDQWQPLNSLGFVLQSPSLSTTPPELPIQSSSPQSFPSTGTLLKSAFTQTKAHWGKILLCLVVAWIAQLTSQLPIQFAQFFGASLGTMIQNALKDLSLPLIIAGVLLILILLGIIVFISQLINLSSQKYILGLLNSEEDRWEKTISCLKSSIIPILFASFVLPFIIVFGFILLIIPGIYFAVGYSYAAIWIFDQKTSFWEGAEASRKAVHRHWFRVFWYMILSIIVMISGVILLGVGLLFTIPMGIVMYLILYRALLHESQKLSSPSS